MKIVKKALASLAIDSPVLNALPYKFDKVYVANGTDAHLVDSLVAHPLQLKLILLLFSVTQTMLLILQLP